MHVVRTSFQPIRRTYRVRVCVARGIHSAPSLTSYNLKYADKLQRKAQEKGLDLHELKSRAHEEARLKQKEETASLLASSKKSASELPRSQTRDNSPPATRTSRNARKDSSPVKPLSSILNIEKFMATPHTPSQISALWTAYHASRSKGTGRGYICASLPVETYNAMTRVAKRYPVFVVPVPRESAPDPSAPESSETAHEFFFLQWNFHPAPPAPSVTEPDPFEPPPAGSSFLQEPSTILFTPLQEYKLRTSFATPYLVLTFYTDLSESHGIVLLRGEITPSTAAVQHGQENLERFLLNQVDAQLLAMGLQKFYLWGEGRVGDHDLTAETLLRQFHEQPEKFSWQDLLELSKVVA
ncbi:ATP11-domain-containing protein [Chiua virens]|nr:ATP11-domain-containing protein [Chiua virens]